jgi:hypothetical protein
MKNTRDAQTVIFRLPRHVHRQIKVLVAKEETSIQGLLEGLVDDYLQSRQAGTSDQAGAA